MLNKLEAIMKAAKAAAQVEYKIFFDTEFSHLGAGAKLLSVGLVDEEGRHPILVEIRENVEKAKEIPAASWTCANVIPQMAVSGNTERRAAHESAGATVVITETEAEAEVVLRNWFNQLRKEGRTNFQLIADVPQYDWVIMSALFGGAFSLPAGVGPTPADLNEMIAQKFGITPNEAFNISRSELISALGGKTVEMHDALNDACTCKQIYERLVRHCEL